jgi:hypothetical protein
VSVMYDKRIQREYPTSFIFVVDQSTSMADPYGEAKMSKADWVATALNRLLQNLVDSATKDEIRHYYDFAVIGYGSTVGPILHGSKPGEEFVPVQTMAMNPRTVDVRTRKTPDGAGGLTEEQIKMATWVESVSNGHTPMYEAFKQVQSLAEKAVRRYPNSYPPTVIHITDGEFTDSDPTPLMEQTKRLSTGDGNVLLFNIHVSGSPGSVFLPSSEAGLPDDYARMLFRASSVLPPVCQYAALLEKFNQVNSQSRGFAFNADPVALVQFLNIGTGRAGSKLLLAAGTPAS